MKIVILWLFSVPVIMSPAVGSSRVVRSSQRYRQHGSHQRSPEFQGFGGVFLDLEEIRATEVVRPIQMPIFSHSRWTEAPDSLDLVAVAVFAEEVDLLKILRFEYNSATASAQTQS